MHPHKKIQTPSKVDAVLVHAHILEWFSSFQYREVRIKDWMKKGGMALYQNSKKMLFMWEENARKS